MAKAAKSRKPGKSGGKPGAASKPRKATPSAKRPAKAMKAMKASEPASSKKSKSAKKSEKSAKAEKAEKVTTVTRAPNGATTTRVRAAEPQVTKAAPKKAVPRALEEIDASEPLLKESGGSTPRPEAPVRPVAVVEQPSMEREGTPPALPVPIASFTF